MMRSIAVLATTVLVSSCANPPPAKVQPPPAPKVVQPELPAAPAKDPDLRVTVVSSREDVFAFTKVPTVERRDDKWVVSFGAKSACDATVSIVDANGKPLRHLASGVLGPKAPAPFLRGSLNQDVVWDELDDNGRKVPITDAQGKPAGIKAMVGLGISPALEKQIEIEPPSVFSRGIAGMAVHKDGSLWFLQGTAWERSIGHPEIAVFSRDGKYQRTIVPARVDLKPDKRPQDLSGVRSVGRRNMIISDGYLVMVSGVESYVAGRKNNKGQRLIRIGLDGSVDDKYAGPVFPEGLSCKRSYLALSPDGKTAYVSGLWSEKVKKSADIVMKAGLSEETFQPYLGEIGVSTNDASHFNSPRGLAVDQAGRLVVCDMMNDRLCVFSPDGKHLKSLPVKGPELVVLNPRTTELYVLSIRDRGEKLDYGGQSKWEPFKDKSVIKFKSIDDFKEVAKIDLPERPLHMHDMGPLITLDSSVTPPLLYATCVGRQEPDDYLWKIEDRGDTLARVDTPVKRYFSPFGPGAGAAATDPVTGDVYLAGRFSPTLYRLSSTTDELVKLDDAAKYVYDGETAPLKARQVSGMAVDRKGRLYLRLMGTWSGASNWIVRVNRDQTPAPFARAGKELAIHQPSHGYHQSTIGIAPNGDLYIVDQVAGGQHRSPTEHNVLNVFTEDGDFKQKDLIPFLTSAAWGPRFDSRNGMYLSEALRPKQYSSESFGSIIRLAEPKGLLAFDEIKPSPDAVYEMRRREKQFIPVNVSGADWIHYGISPVPFGHCICASAPFDVDPFDRVFVSDSHKNRVQILDVAGNVITFIGEYGNRDSQRSGSNLPVPPIPVQGLNSLACGDDVVFIWDSPVSRLLKVRLTYAARTTAPFAMQPAPAQK